MTLQHGTSLLREPAGAGGTLSGPATEDTSAYQVLQFGDAALSVPARVLQSPGTDEERRMATRVEVAQKELDLHLTRFPQVWRDVLEEMPNGESVRARWVFLTGNRMTSRGQCITVRTLEAAVEAAISGDPAQLKTLVKSFRLSPSFTHKLYAAIERREWALEGLYARWRRAVNELAERFYRLAIKVINGRQYGTDRNSELYSEAALALISAAERYQPELGRFSTFAHWLIQTSVCNQYDKFQALRTDVEVENVIDDDKRQSATDSETESFLEGMEQQYLAVELLDELNDRERFIIENIFGLGADQQLCRSANDLAAELKLTKGRVAQIKKAALAKMLERAREMNLTPLTEQ